MVLKITTNTGIDYLLDKDLMNWRMFVKKDDENGTAAYRTGGKLYNWPDQITVGKRMQIFKKEPMQGIGMPFLTGVVVKIEPIKREVPDVADDEPQPA